MRATGKNGPAVRFLVVSFLILATAHPAPGQGSTPGLVQTGVWLDVSQPECMTRAAAALDAGGLRLDTAGAPSANARGGRDANLFAIINCLECGGRVLAHLSMAMSPGFMDTSRILFLRDFMRSGAAATTATGTCTPFSGSWNSSSGGTGLPITFQRSGNQVTGQYTFMNHSSSIRGTVSGNTLEGEYLQPTYPEERYKRGRLRFVMNPDGRGWKGEWWDANGVFGGAWDGVCLTPTTGTMPGTATPAAPGPGGALNLAGPGGTPGAGTSISGCAPFSGPWNSSSEGVRLPIAFERAGNRVSGRYTFSGYASSIQGTVAGNVLEGEYLQPTYPDVRFKRGRLRFVMNADGNGWKGEWWDANGALGGAWDGSCPPGAQTPASGGGSAPPSSAGGTCSDPALLARMDEWLGAANPPQNQQPGWSVRYEAWGRLVGRSPSASLAVSGAPDTHLTRCEWLWQQSASLRSTNLGTLREYLEGER